MLKGIAKDGHIGEWFALDVIKKIFSSDGPVMQVDWIFEKGGQYYLVEVKHQEIYIPPPFYGHGLPKWQIEARLKFYEKTGIRPILLVIEKPLKAVYAQYLDVLNESNNYLDTNGAKPRRVFNINEFEDFTEETEELRERANSNL